MMELNVFDYRKITKALIAFVSKEVLGTPCIEDNGSGEQPPHPFTTFTITTPHIAIEQFEGSGEEFEAVLSITYHSLSSLDALNSTQRLKTAFEHHNGSDFFRKNDIIIVSIDNLDRRDNFISIDYERTAGFDVRIRVVNTLNELDGFSDIQINNEMG